MWSITPPVDQICPVLDFVFLPYQFLTAPANLIQFLMVAFVEDILDLLLQILGRYRNVVDVFYETQLTKRPAY